MGGWVPRSFHHLERARHVCNSLSHAWLQTVFSLWKLYTELDGWGLTNTHPQFPTGPVAFSQIDVQAAHTGWEHITTNTSTRMSTMLICARTRTPALRQEGKTQEQFVCSFSALFGICRLQCQTDNHYRSNQIACCPRCLWKQACLNNYSLTQPHSSSLRWNTGSFKKLWYVWFHEQDATVGGWGGG